MTSMLPPDVRDVVRSPGQPLDEATRAFMEPYFGHDFSDVRVHLDDRAADSATAIAADGYTYGQHVVFGPRRFAPSTAMGRKLIAHELAHTIQQRGAGAAGASNAAASEQEAESAADGAIKAVRRPVLTRSGLSIARQPSQDIEAQLKQIDAQIWYLHQQLMMPVQPLRDVYLAQLEHLEVRRQQVLGGGGGPSKPQPSPITQAEQARLNAKAELLAEKQARRREFWNSLGDYNSYFVEQFLLKSRDFRAKLADLDIYWDKANEDFRRDPKIDALEDEVLDNPESKRIYDTTLWDLLYNKPAKKSWFDDVIGFACKYTNPCHDNMEAFHADLDSGMSRDEALARGLARLSIMLIPTEGPQGPIAIGPGGGPGAFPMDINPRTEAPNPVPKPAPDVTPSESTSSSTPSAGSVPKPADVPTPSKPSGAPAKTELAPTVAAETTEQPATTDTTPSRDPGKGARARASKTGIALRKKLAYERMSTGQYDPLQDLLSADERAAFLDSKGKDLPKNIDWHHTRQSSADPGMADVPEHIQPERYVEHKYGEHSARPADVPTAGIRRDVTTPAKPIYDPNAPEVQTGRFDPNAPAGEGSLEEQGLSEREFGKRAPPNFKDLSKVREPALKPYYDYQIKAENGVWRHVKGTKTWLFFPKK